MTDAKKRAIRTAVQAIVTLTSVQGLGLIAKACGLEPSQDQLLLLSIILLPVVTLAQCWLEDRSTIPTMLYPLPNNLTLERVYPPVPFPAPDEMKGDNGEC